MLGTPPEQARDRLVHAGADQAQNDVQKDKSERNLECRNVRNLLCFLDELRREQRLNSRTFVEEVKMTTMEFSVGRRPC